jgi:hypothetical protein
VAVESDYPHQDSTWPDTQQLISSEMGHLRPEIVRKIAYGTAAKLYQHPEPPAEWLARSVIGAAG